jgi:hypothetical protein
MRDRDGFLTGVSLFRTVLFWPTSPTPRLPRLPSERDKHVLERSVGGRREIPGGGSWILSTRRVVSCREILYECNLARQI